MVKKTYLVIVVLSVLFTNCRREQLQVHPAITHLSDFESNDGKVSLNISGGKAPYTIEWSNAISDSVVSDLTAGKYFITVTDSKKSILEDTIEVNQPQWPVCLDAEGNSYKTTIIGNQIWMLENLRVTKNSMGTDIESYVYDNIEENALTYGRLYTWSVAMNDSIDNEAQGICPDGWHLPSREEWDLLIDNISTVDKDIPNIKKTLDLDYAGFYNNSFNNLGASISFWTSTESNDNAWKLYFHKSLSKAFRYHEKKTNAISVRCLKNPHES
ncbi:MAG: FISUMP domain-containing protein [Salinivirgaceae bacterium]|jgi:uncharacterized protein (TIGR02145 family)|nr:FISUMP domain-containing protein [Salinivirgaceae bacterium]